MSTSIDLSISSVVRDPNSPEKRTALSKLLRDTYSTEKVTVVVPTKSNFSGLKTLVDIVKLDPQTEKIIVVADGLSAYSDCLRLFSDSDMVIVEDVGLGVGIHHMWNIGIYHGRKNKTTVAFLNDDVVPEDFSVGTLASLLAHKKELGLVCPDYDKRTFNNWLIDTNTTCRGRYDGTGGFAGFFMVLAKDLVQDWYFDERMKWWYGDDDVVMWCLSRGRRVVIASITGCSGNNSHTTDSNPPKNFSELVYRDKEVYEQKWGGVKY
jgi:hypothetical protein